VNIPIGIQRWAIAMITTIRSIGQFSAENFNDAFSENYSLLAQANILLLLKLYEYQKKQSKQLQM
jgi:hypothetical protein